MYLHRASTTKPHAVIPTKEACLPVGRNLYMYQHLLMEKYFVYIICNQSKAVLYVGVTNNWQRRINEHIADAENNKQTFAGKYNCRYLLHLEEFMFPRDTIQREKEIKGWNRTKKEKLISLHNPEWNFLNQE